jgi:hypothetical protein
MDARKNIPTPCIVRDSAMRYARRAGLISESIDEFNEIQIIESVSRLMAMGLRMDELDGLNIRESMLDAISKIDQNGENNRSSKNSSSGVDATLRIVNDEIGKVDIELEMLGMRKRALTKRVKTLEKIVRMLESD